MSLSRLDVLLREGELEMARQEIDGRLKRNPNDREALLGRARLKVFDSELAEAEVLLQQAEKTGGEDALSKLVKAGLAAQKGNAAQAIELYRAVIQEAPERPDAHFGLGFLLASEGKYPEAKAQLQEAVKLDENSSVFHLHLARVLFENEEPQEALDHLGKSVELNPTDVAAWLIFAVVFQELGDLDAAAESLNKGLEVLPKHPDLLTALTNILVAKGDLKGAHAIANQVAAQSPNDPNARNNVARFLVAQGRFEEAMASCQDLENQGIANATTYAIAAMALESAETPDFEAAAASWREAMKLAPDDWAPANNLGNLLLRVSQLGEGSSVEEAIEVLEEARKRGPDRPEPLLNLALAYARQGKKDEARKLAQGLIDRGIPETDEIGEQARRLLTKL